MHTTDKWITLKDAAVRRYEVMLDAEFKMEMAQGDQNAVSNYQAQKEAWQNATKNLRTYYDGVK